MLTGAGLVLASATTLFWLLNRMFVFSLYSFVSPHFCGSKIFSTDGTLTHATVAVESECSVCFEGSSGESVREAASTKQQQQQQRETSVFVVD